MNNYLNLIKIDLIRIWGLKKIILISVLGIVACILSGLPAWMGWIKPTDSMYMPFTDYLLQLWKIIIPFSVLFFTSGIISNDIKNHWIRSVMVHKVTREEIVITKLVSSLISVFFVMIILGFLPVIVFTMTLNLGLNIDILNFIQVLCYSILEAGLFISISIWLSCFLGGFMNVFILGFWMFLDNIVMKGILTLWLSNNLTGSVIIDFFFPSGFSEASMIASGSGIFPYEFLIWGITSLMFFISVSLYHFNRLTIDINSD